MVFIILAGFAVSGFLLAISAVNELPQDQAEADLYLRGPIPDWRNDPDWRIGGM